MGRPTRRGPWLPEEDGTLLQLVHLQGPNNWVRISKHMQDRSPKQCRERYHQNLKPSLNHEPISPKEGEAIEQLVQDMGKRWAEIARRLGNRSDNAVKNWWNGSMNRRKRHPVLNGHSPRGVGSRAQPIPNSPPSRPAIDFGSRFHFNTTQKPSFTSGMRFEEGQSEADYCFEKGYISSSYPHPPPPVTEPDMHHRSISLPKPPGLRPALSFDTRSAPTSVHNTPDPFSLRSLHNQSTQQNLRPPPLESRHSYPAEWPLPRPQALEPSAISPSATEFSSLPPAHQAPSLVSDNQSHYSISPKTVSSPRPGLPAPIDTSNVRTWEHVQRRDGYTPYGPSSKWSAHDEGYVSAFPPSSTAESATSRFPLDPLLKRPISEFRLESPTDARVQGSATASPTERDARMHLSRLVD